MRPAARRIGTLMIVAGALLLVWSVVVWQWQDPFTALYTKYRQHQLASQYSKAAAAYDAVRIELPYADFRYEITTHVIVRADDVSRLRSHHRELLALQACHPRFFAS